MTTAVRARWIVPVSRPPLRDGVLSIADGRIVAVGENLTGRAPLDLGDVAIFPGLVNAHTHLEFSSLAEPLGHSGMPFPEWIRGVVERRRAAVRETTVDEQAAAREQALFAGYAELSRGATVAAGDVATPDMPLPTTDEPTRTIVFRELLGLRAARIEPLVEVARQHLARAQQAAASGATWRAGLSPHAPYTVHPELLRRVCQLSADAGVPVAMHLAESFDELELLQSHSGRFRELLEDLEAWDPTAIPRGLRPRDYLEVLSTAARALVIHGNFLGATDWQFLAQQRERMTVVYCPRTYAYFGLTHYPLADMLAAGVRVAVGTDSRATNPNLDLLAELRFVRQTHPAVAPEEVLRMGTVAAAEALGIAAEFGCLESGRAARCAIVSGMPADTEDPVEALLSSDLPVTVTVGSW